MRALNHEGAEMNLFVKRVIFLVAAAVMLGFGQPASAAIVSIDITGTVVDPAGGSALDVTGVFTNPGTDLNGIAYSANFT
jgi:hypothetical protein